MDTVERHIERLKAAITRHEQAVDAARAACNKGVGTNKEIYEKHCIAVARRVLGPDRVISISAGKKGERALMNAATGRAEYDAAEEAASAEFDAALLRLELVRDDVIAAADRAFLLEEAEIQSEDDKPQPPRKGVAA